MYRRDETAALEMAVMEALKTVTGGGSGGVGGNALLPSSAVLTTATRPYVINDRHGITQPIVIDPASISRLIQQATNASSSSSAAVVASTASSVAIRRNDLPPSADSGSQGALLGCRKFSSDWLSALMIDQCWSILIVQLSLTFYLTSLSTL